MKCGVCTNFLSEDKYSLHTDSLKSLAGIFDFIEFPAFPIAAMDDCGFERFAAVLSSNRISCDFITNLFPASLRLMEQPDGGGPAAAYLEKLLPRLKRMGCRGLVLGSGPSRTLPEGMGKEQGDRRMIRLVSETILPLAAAFSMELLLEPLTPKLCNYLNTIEEAALICGACGGAVGIAADSFNLMEDARTLRQLVEYSGHIRHVHISEAQRRCPGEPLSDELERFISALNAGGYAGAISLECRISVPDGCRSARESVTARFNNFREERNCK